MCLHDGAWLLALLSSAMRRPCSRQPLPPPQYGPQNKDTWDKFEPDLAQPSQPGFAEPQSTYKPAEQQLFVVISH